jgi:uncharacterized membrane protein
MSYREKTAWIMMLSMLGIYAWYFWSIIHHGTGDGRLHLGGLLVTIVALVVVQVVLLIVFAILAPRDANAPRDERDKLIELRAMRVAYAGLATSVALACFFGAFNPPIVFGTNALLFILVTAEILRYACQIIQYRRSA